MILRVVGKVCIGLGILILLFLAYQLWGTTLITKQQQTQLLEKVEKEWAGAEEEPSEEPADVGTGVAIIRIPKISVSQVVVEGVEVADLKKGPGHYPGTAMPGEEGNVVVSGHRTTYGAPFYRLDELSKGDAIELRSREGSFTYRVTESKIVKPTDIAVINPTSDARLTLTTCHPRFSARQRLIIVASLVVKPEGAI